MSEQVTFQVSFQPFGAFVPYSGEGASDVLQKDGDYRIKWRAIKPYMSKPKPTAENPNPVPKPMIKVIGNILDKDEEGRNIVEDVTCGGKDKNGDDMGRQLMELLCASEVTDANGNVTQPWTAEKIQAAAKANPPMVMSIDDIIKALLLPNLVSHGFLQGALTQDGKETTEVRSWISGAKYRQNVELKSHRKPRRQAAAAAQSQAAMQFNLGGPGAAPQAGFPGFATAPNGAQPAAGTPPTAPAGQGGFL